MSASQVWPRRVLSRLLSSTNCLRRSCNALSRRISSVSGGHSGSSSRCPIWRIHTVRLGQPPEAGGKGPRAARIDPQRRHSCRRQGRTQRSLIAAGGLKGHTPAPFGHPTGEPCQLCVNNSLMPIGPDHVDPVLCHIDTEDVFHHNPPVPVARDRWQPSQSSVQDKPKRAGLKPTDDVLASGYLRAPARDHYRTFQTDWIFPAR